MHWVSGDIGWPTSTASQAKGKKFQKDKHQVGAITFNDTHKHTYLTIYYMVYVNGVT